MTWLLLIRRPTWIARNSRVCPLGIASGVEKMLDARFALVQIRKHIILAASHRRNAAQRNRSEAPCQGRTASGTTQLIIKQAVD
jgi:hypothetical protein